MIDIELKAKYTDRSPIKNQPYKPRTGNSHGPNKDSLPARQPCHRAKAGAKVFVPQRHVHRHMELWVDGLTGKRTFRERETA